MAVYSSSGQELAIIYDADGDNLTVAYDDDGDEIFNAAPPEPYAPELTFLQSISMSEFNPNRIISPQGMAIYGDYIAQYFTNDDSLRLIDMRDWSIDGAYSLPEFLHGNGLIFGNTVQPSGFPLLYGSQFGESASVESRLIAIAEIGLSSYVIDGYYTIPAAAGYHPQFVADWTNGKAYTIGYSQLSIEYGNMIISEYNISDMETIVDQWTVSYTGIVQGTCFWNGYFIVIGDSYDYSKMRLSFISVTSHEKTEYQFTKKQDHRMEFQGVDVYNNNLIISSWIYDDEDNQKLKYWLYTVNLPVNGQQI